jgi:hypothetical protein
MAREDSLLWLIITPIFKWLKTRHSWISIFGTFILLVSGDPFNATPGSGGSTGPDNSLEDTIPYSGYVREGPSNAVPERFDLNGTRIWTIEVRFTAMDEPPARQFRFTNEADDFVVTVTLPDGREVEGSDHTNYGTNKEAAIIFDFDFNDDGGWDTSEEGGNIVMVNVECTTADDHYPFFSPFNTRTIADDGNNYEIAVRYSYDE